MADVFELETHAWPGAYADTAFFHARCRISGWLPYEYGTFSGQRATFTPNGIA